MKQYLPFKTLLLFFAIFISNNFFSQELIKAPKQKSLGLTVNCLLPTIYKNDLDSNYYRKPLINYGIAREYSWQLTGFGAKKAAVYITIPIIYSIQYKQSNLSYQSWNLRYGWSIRHELTKHKKFTPFLSYNLLLSSLRIKGYTGSVFGHNTGFNFGYNYYTDKKISYFLQVNYDYIRYPKLGVKESVHVQSFGGTMGMRF